MQPTNAIEYFEENAEHYATWTSMSRAFRERSKIFGDLIRRARAATGGGLCLDIGCGNGALSRLAADSGFDVIGLDGASTMLSLAQAQTDTAAVTYRQARIPLPPNVIAEFRAAADLIVSSSVVEYLEDDGSFLSQCRELLKPTGLALISYPNRQALYRRMERTLGNNGPLEGSVVSVQMIQRTPDEVRAIAAEHKLALQNVRYFGLPYQERLDRFVRVRPPWLATLFVALLKPLANAI